MARRTRGQSLSTALDLRVRSSVPVRATPPARRNAEQGSARSSLLREHHQAQPVARKKPWAASSSCERRAGAHSTCACTRSHGVCRLDDFKLNPVATRIHKRGKRLRRRDHTRTQGWQPACQAPWHRTQPAPGTHTPVCGECACARQDRGAARTPQAPPPAARSTATTGRSEVLAISSTPAASSAAYTPRL